jgi:hypothetical protein
MGVTKADLDAQRAMLERGEEIRKAARQAEERERLRDTFAAAALTGLLSHQKCHYADDIDEPARDAYAYADAMLREGEKQTDPPCVETDAAPSGTRPFRLTDEEREAVEWFRKPLTRLTQSHNRERYKATLRKLLERLS